MLKKYNIQENNKRIKTLLYVILVLTLMILKNKVAAANITIISPSKINVGDTATITIDFGTYIGAYDLFQLTYNSRILEYTGTESLVSKCWFDNSQNSNGIRYKTFTFKGKKNGTVNIGLNIKTVTSANNTMDALGDFNGSKKIIVGTGIEAGDINNDSYINSTDAAIILDKYKNEGITKTDLERGDINEDGIINAIDAAMVLDIFKNS